MEPEELTLTWLDLTYPIDHDTPVYPGDPPVGVVPLTTGPDDGGCRVHALSLTTHSGTHVDAPAHLWPTGATLGDWPLDLWLGPARLVERTDLGRLGPGGPPRLLIRGCLDGLDPAEARLVAKAGVRLVGVDGPGVDPIGSTDLPAHRALLGAGIAVVERLQLHHVPPGEGWLACLPLPVAAGDGAPARALWCPRDREGTMAKRARRRAGGEGWSVTRSDPVAGVVPAPADRRRAKIRLEIRRGRPVTRCDLEGVRPEEIPPLAKKFKTTLGTGGTVRADGLDLQGDHRPWVRRALADAGFEVRG